jgi:hypothetical protein
VLDSRHTCEAYQTSCVETIQRNPRVIERVWSSPGWLAWAESCVLHQVQLVTTCMVTTNGEKRRTEVDNDMIMYMIISLSTSVESNGSTCATIALWLLDVIHCRNTVDPFSLTVHPARVCSSLVCHPSTLFIPSLDLYSWHMAGTMLEGHYELACNVVCM